MLIRNKLTQIQDLTEIEKAEAKIQDGDNILKYDTNIDLGKASGKSAIGATGGIVGKGGTKKTIFHESGHELGFQDRYKLFGEEFLISDPVYNDDAMTGGNGYLGKRNLLHFYNVYKEGIKQLDLNLGKNIINKVINNGLDSPPNINSDGVDPGTENQFKEAKSFECPD